MGGPSPVRRKARHHKRLRARQVRPPAGSEVVPQREVEPSEPFQQELGKGRVAVAPCPNRSLGLHPNWPASTSFFT